VAGVALAVASQAQAQFGYAADDLLLNFRNTALEGPNTTPPGTVTGNDLEVNMGSILTIAAFSGTEEVLAPGSLGTLQSQFGANLNNIGFSAAAADAPGSDGALWLTRPETAANTPGPNPAKVAYSVANPVTGYIASIGAGATAGTQLANDVLGNSVAAVAASVSGNSYQAQAAAGPTAANQAVINYQGQLNVTTPSKGGAIESIMGGTTVYEALWAQPAGNGTSGDSYLGYFTFDSNGEVDYTSANYVAPVPEASTYGLIAGLGLLGLALRRQFRTLVA
jgi:hypothetical protein